MDKTATNVLFLEFSSQMSLDKSGLSDSSVANKDDFEFGHQLYLVGLLDKARDTISNVDIIKELLQIWI